MLLTFQKEGRYVEVPTLLLYSEANLGARYNMKEIWEKFVNNRVKAHGIGDEAGHFVNEESPEECTQVLLEWLKTIV
jgi:pimeloyl-ACP methyl ester carboxylesterase